MQDCRISNFLEFLKKRNLTVHILNFISVCIVSKEICKLILIGKSFRCFLNLFYQKKTQKNYKKNKKKGHIPKKILSRFWNRILLRWLFYQNSLPSLNFAINSFQKRKYSVQTIKSELLTILQDSTSVLWNSYQSKILFWNGNPSTDNSSYGPNLHLQGSYLCLRKVFDTSRVTRIIYVIKILIYTNSSNVITLNIYYTLCLSADMYLVMLRLYL